MEISRVILGPVVTEKAERAKASELRTYTLRIAPEANKIDVQNALKRFYGIGVKSVRVLYVRPKTRAFGRSQQMEKRHRTKRAIVTLTKESKPLDITAFQKSAS